MPVFHRISWAKEIPCTAIYYFDPTCYLGDLSAGYGYGTNDRWYLKQIAVLIERILNKLDIPLTNTLFYGSSVGGFTSICLAAMLHSRATVINPRLNAEKTIPRVWASLNDNCLKEGETFLPERTNVMAVFQNENYFPVLHIIQNIGDKFNMETQIIPFLDQMSKEPMNCTDRLHFEFYFLEGGHNAGPPTDVCLRQIVDDLPECIPMRVSLSIYGSCVSRDIFAIANDTKFDLKAYIARQSVISAVAPKIPEGKIPLQNSSPWRMRAVECDLQKSTFDILKQEKSDYLLIDLIDERFPLLPLFGSYVTASNEFYESAPEKYRSASKLAKSEKNGEIYLGEICMEETIREFCSRLKEIYAPEQIIIHHALMSDYYMGKNGERKEFGIPQKSMNHRLNAVMEAMYQRLQTYLPGAHVIRETNGMVADEDHKWGLAPMHYQKEYYERVLARLYEIAGL